MDKVNEKYLKITNNGAMRHIKTGDKFILENHRRNTFVYSLFECSAYGLHFITPSTIKKQFNKKMKVWFADFDVLPENNEGFFVKINEPQDIIIRYFLGTNYNLVKEYDYKPIDNYFMVFEPHNDYQFKGVFQPKKWKTTEKYFYVQKFVKIADEIKFTPMHNKKDVQTDDEMDKILKEIFSKENEL